MMTAPVTSPQARSGFSGKMQPLFNLENTCTHFSCGDKVMKEVRRDNQRWHFAHSRLGFSGCQMHGVLALGGA